MSLRSAKAMSQFTAWTLLCFVCATAVWETGVATWLYDCTDSLGPGFLSPGEWVHHPVSSDYISTNRAMGEPDLIRAGWTETHLWVFWGLLVAVSFATAAWLTRRSSGGSPSSMRKSSP